MDLETKLVKNVSRRPIKNCLCTLALVPNSWVMQTKYLTLNAEILHCIFAFYHENHRKIYRNIEFKKCFNFFEDNFGPLPYSLLASLFSWYRADCCKQKNCRMPSSNRVTQKYTAIEMVRSFSWTHQ